MVYGPGLPQTASVREVALRGLHSTLGTNRLTPGRLILVQPLDFLLHPNETYRVADPEMTRLAPERPCALAAARQHLRPALPYDTSG